MIPLKKALNSTIGKKYVMAVTGLALLGFLVTHLAANMLLYLPDPEPFNRYPHALASYGPLLYVAEIGLGVLFLVHAVMAFGIHFKDKRDARPEGYIAGQSSKGGGSRFNLASVNMIVTGMVLFGFLIMHVLQFRFELLMPSATTMIDGEPARDLYGLVQQTFQDPIWVVIYVAVMGFLGLHLRHGFWSAFQSLGAMKPEWSKAIYAAGFVIALIFAVGFLFIPISFYFDVPGRL